jgi:hypothetical protein
MKINAMQRLSGGDTYLKSLNNDLNMHYTEVGVKLKPSCCSTTDFTTLFCFVFPLRHLLRLFALASVQVFRSFR